MQPINNAAVQVVQTALWKRLPELPTDIKSREALDRIGRFVRNLESVQLAIDFMGDETQKYSDAAKTLLKEYNLTEPNEVPLASWESKVGINSLGDITLHAPWPVSSANEFYVLAHECGHLRMHVGEPGNPKDPTFGEAHKRQPIRRARWEFQAERFAERQFRRFGFEVPYLKQVAARLNVLSYLILNGRTPEVDRFLSRIETWVAQTPEAKDTLDYVKSLPMKTTHSGILEQIRTFIEKGLLSTSKQNVGPPPGAIEMSPKALIDLMVSSQLKPEHIKVVTMNGDGMVLEVPDHAFERITKH